jgi:hypothetical protein
MLVMRDALLWQLHKDRLRQEIIVGELAKIERTVALRTTSGHHTTAMPWDSMPQHRGPIFGWEHYGDVSEENDVKLPPNNDRQTAESRFPKPVGEDRANKSCNTCKCGCNAGPQSSAFDDLKLQDPVQVSSLSILYCFHVSFVLPHHNNICVYFVQTRLETASIGPFLLLPHDRT